MERLERTIKLGLASLLLVMMLALTGLAVTQTAANGGLATLTSAAITAAQNVAKSNTSTPTDNNASPTTTTEQTSAAQQTQGGVVDATYAVKQAGPAVVTIVNTMQVSSGRGGRFGGGTQTAEALGSGIIIDSQGFIVTNQHVVANHESLQVIF